MNPDRSHTLSRESHYKVILEGLFKFKQTTLLVISMYAAFIAGGGLGHSLSYHLIVIADSYLAISAVTALNMYFDRDIDALMERTKHRPLPSGLISPRTALILAILMLLASILIGLYYINLGFTIAIILGFVFDIIAYTLLLKRRTPLNIVAGALAGGAPSIGGWAAATGSIDVNAILFSLLVVAWVPAHIWFLASYLREDYLRARIPMLPAVSDPVVTALGVGMGALMMGYSIVGLCLNNVIGTVTCGYGLLAAVHIFMLAIKFSTISREYHKSYSRKAFKIANMHLGVLYLLLVLEKILAS